jgi:hypothetical protein
LYKRWEGEDGKKQQLLVVVPLTMTPKILKELHTLKKAVHMGIRKTLTKVRQRYFCAGMSADVMLHITARDVPNTKNLITSRRRR